MELIYKKAGHLELLRYKDNKRFLFTGVVQSLVPSITGKSATLEDGNSDWDYEFSTGKEGQITVNLNSFVPRLYAALVASEYKEESNLAIRRIEEISVPSESPYSVELKKTPEASTIVIVNEDDSPFVSGSPVVKGGYKVSGDTVEFNSADAGTYLMVAYDYKAATGRQSGMDEQTHDDIFQATITGEACRKDNESIVIADSMTFDRTKATGELAMPPRQSEPAGWNFTLKVLKPRPGYKVVDHRIEVPSI